MARILVTGGAGFIRSNSVDPRIKAEIHVIYLATESSEDNDKFFWNS